MQTRKLKLEVGALKVESFQAGSGGEHQGTVYGRAAETDTCSYGPTYYYTCRNCDPTAGFEASCGLWNTYCGTYPEVGCPNSVGYCTAYGMIC